MQVPARGPNTVPTVVARDTGRVLVGRVVEGVAVVEPKPTAPKVTPQVGGVLALPPPARVSWKERAGEDRPTPSTATMEKFQGG